MKIEHLKLNERFLTDSDTEFQLLATPEMLTKEEKKNHADRFRCVNTDTGEEFYLMDNMRIRKSK